MTDLDVWTQVLETRGVQADAAVLWAPLLAECCTPGAFPDGVAGMDRFLNKMLKDSKNLTKPEKVVWPALIVPENVIESISG